jgi:SAM-dependent methyltransferase
VIPAVGEPEFWRERYQRGEAGWDLGQPAPALAARLRRAPPPPGRVAVPGCGRGHDARLLARHGYQVWGFDFAPEALADARRLAEHDGAAVAFEERDVFDLARDRAEAFDGVWEYTCYCAIDPGRRAEYLDVLAALLRPGGWLLACFFPLREPPPGAPPGPPFPVTAAEIDGLLGPRFEVLESGPPEASPPARQGQEWLVLARTRRPTGRVSEGTGSPSVEGSA